MPVEEGTGLHAFDNLDPVSTVSALSAMPETEPEREPSSARLVPPPRSTVPPPIASRSAPPPPRRPIGAPGGANGMAGALAPIAPPLPSAARTTAPPPPPPTARKSSIPPPVPRGGVGGRSVPPAPPRLAESEEPDQAPIEARGEAEEDTRVVPNAFAHDPEFAPTSAFPRAPGESGEGAFEAFDGLDSAQTQVSHDRSAATQERAEATAGSPPRNGNGIDDTALLELAASTSATPIDMEWDEDEVQTKLRDGGSNPDVSKAAAPLPYVGAQPSPFPPPSAAAAAFSGNPSPFVAPPTGFAPVAANAREWEDEDEAMTRVMAHGPASGAPPAISVSGRWTPAVGVQPWAGGETLAGEAPGERPLLSNRLAWLGFAAVALIAFTVAARALTAGRQPATVTVVTKPTDALVTVDGQPRTGESSPFTLPNLEPGVEHTIDVSKPGFATASHHFRVKAGEIKPLPSIELAAMRVDTGFALTSLPGGASVYVDGLKLDQVTPIRIGDLAQGLHVVRLEYGNAYQPWETQVALAAGQVIELPTARLMPAGPSARQQLIGAGTPSNLGGTRQDRKNEDTGSVHHHHTEVHERASMPQPAMHASMPAMRPSAPAPAFGGGFGSGGGGSQGTLRINSRPWSQVFVDGRMIGNTPQLNLALSPGHHNIKLVNPQLGMSKGFGVDIRAGKVATKIVDLQ